MSDAPAIRSRRLPLVPIVWGAWIVLYVLMMWHGGWQWSGPNILAVGMVPDPSLRLFGAGSRPGSRPSCRTPCSR